MIRHSKILLAGLILTFCLSALVIFPVSAGGDAADPSPATAGDICEDNPAGICDDSDSETGTSECGRDRIGELKREKQIEEHLVLLEDLGIDVSEIRAAFEWGDFRAVSAMMTELPEEGAPGAGEESGRI